MKNKLAPGDVLEVALPDGRLGYLLYLGKHREYGDAVLVPPRTYKERPNAFAKAFDGGYVAFYPAGAALNQKLVQVVAKQKIPAGMLPTRVRRPGARAGTRIESWVIEDDSGESVSTKLSDDDRSLPIAAIWNHEFLVQRIVEKWRPEMEGSNGAPTDGN
jgi:hypothetical protein